jgi:putative salt-induced outer membrane protein
MSKDTPMKKILFAGALLALLPLAAHADKDEGWSGSGEVGFAAARGNAESESLNAKLQLKKEDDNWKNHFYLNALRNKGEVKTTVVVDGEPTTVSTFETTANRYDAGASVGYKLDERSYIVGALRYENDDFSAYEYQSVASIGYGYTLIKNERSELSFEAGPGYKRYRPVDTVTTVGDPPEIVVVHSDAEGELVGRGLVAYRHKFTDTTAFENTTLVESGQDNTFLQNDASVAVSINKSFALKVGYQGRHNSDASPGTEKTDQLLTTNLVYNFGG